MNGRCCFHCQYFAIWPKQPNGCAGIGDCRRHAPQQFHSAKTDKIMTKWPSVKETDFCGSFRSMHEPAPQLEPDRNVVAPAPEMKWP